MTDQLKTFVDENENEVVYGITLDYIVDWGIRDAVREIMSNAKDTGATFKAYLENGTDFVIEDDGEGINKEYLLVDESASRNKQDAIGEFAEGLKMAILVFTRMDKLVTITTQNYQAQNAKVIKFGKVCFKLMMEEHEPVQGTKIVVHDLPEAIEHLDMFLFTKSPEELKELIVAVTPDGSVTYDRKLYAKGVYCQDLDLYEFGYDSPYIKMNRDRKAAKEWDVQVNVGKIWGNMRDPQAWKVFFEACMDGAYERNIYPEYKDEHVLRAFKLGFYEAFGENAVYKTTTDATREAEHRGANSINLNGFGYYMQSSIKRLMQSDEEYVVEKRGQQAFKVPDKELTTQQKKNRTTLRRMAKKVGFNGEVIIARLPSARGNTDGHVIRINYDLIDDLFESKTTMIHELAHAIYNTVDMTEEHVSACCRIGVLLNE